MGNPTSPDMGSGHLHRCWVGPEHPRMGSTALGSSSQPGVPTAGLTCPPRAVHGTGQGSAPLAQIFICISLLTYPVRANYLNLN